MDRQGAARIVHRTAKNAGLGDKKISPHTLRHAFITAALDAGVPLRDVQEAASHADPRTTMRDDRARVSLDRHATYTDAADLAGARNDHPTRRPSHPSRRSRYPACARRTGALISTEQPFVRGPIPGPGAGDGADRACCRKRASTATLLGWRQRRTTRRYG
jgi:Phage integrase family